MISIQLSSTSLTQRLKNLIVPSVTFQSSELYFSWQQTMQQIYDKAGLLPFELQIHLGILLNAGSDSGLGQYLRFYIYSKSPHGTAAGLWVQKGLQVGGRGGKGGQHITQKAVEQTNIIRSLAHSITESEPCFIKCITQIMEVILKQAVM